MAFGEDIGGHPRSLSVRTVRQHALSRAVLDPVLAFLERQRPMFSLASLVMYTLAVQLSATERLGKTGVPPLPHTLRRTYISIALLANNFDVKWVMSQVGHADSKMTLDLYAQLEQRVQRSHGTSFDRLIRGATLDTTNALTPGPVQDD